MEDVFQLVAERYKPDMWLFGSSNQMHSNGYSAAGPRCLSNELQARPDLMQYHPNVVDVERWMRILRPRYVMPYAQFILDGRQCSDLHLNALARTDVYSDYWRDFVPDRLPAESVAQWRCQLEHIVALQQATLVMLHPLQGIWL